MKLYEIPKGSKIKCELKNTTTGDVREEMIEFHHLDGAYSYCTAPDGSILRLSASTFLEKEDDHYIIWTPEI